MVDILEKQNPEPKGTPKGDVFGSEVGGRVSPQVGPPEEDAFGRWDTGAQ
jgi:hypothetical protein